MGSQGSEGGNGELSLDLHITHEVVDIGAGSRGVWSSAWSPRSHFLRHLAYSGVGNFKAGFGLDLIQTRP